MAYIPAKNPKVGDWVHTTIVHESLAGKFTKGSYVEIIGIDAMRGYDIRDAEGNTMYEIGWTI